MSASNQKIWLVILISLIVGGGAIYYAIKVIGERSDRKLITSQVEQWDEAWSRTRACIVGDEPASSSGSEALLVLEGTYPTDPARLRSCEKLIRNVIRPGSAQTGNAAIEQRWNELAKATKAVGNGIVMNIDTASARPYQERRARLAAAIDELDAAYARLRETSKLDPAPPPGPGPLPVLDAGVVVRAGQDPLALEQVSVLDDLLAIAGDAGDAPVHAIVRGPAQIAIHRERDGTMRAADDAAWGVWHATRPDQRLEMRTGPIDESGAATGEGVVALVTTGADDDLTAYMALGSGAGRAIVYLPSTPGQPTRGLFVVRSTDTGQTWSKPVQLSISPPLWLGVDRARRRFDVAWKDEANLVRWLTLRADRLTQPVRPRRLLDAGDSMPVLSACLGERAGWWLSDGVYHVAGDSKAAVAIPGPDGQQIEAIGPCNDERALIRTWTDEGLEIHACDARACKTQNIVPVANGGDEAIALTARGPVMVTRINHVLMVWKLSGGEPAAYALPDASPEQPGSLKAAIEWNGALHAAMAMDDQLRLFRLPLE